MTSKELLRRALAVIPGGGQTDTKTPAFRLLGIQPSFFKKGRGTYAQDVDGDWWLDCQMGLAAYVLGYADKLVNEYVAKQSTTGSLFSLSSPLELEVAELLLEIFPEFEMVRFAKNGSDVTSAAIRIARYHTARDHVIGCGYHGFQDWSMALRPEVGGIPASVRQLTHGNEDVDLLDALTKLEAGAERYAAVIVDTGGYGLPDFALLRLLQERCRFNRVVFIMDEVVSGFRVGLRGTMGECGIVPDLLCLGKAVANGFPLSVLMGAKHLMRLAPAAGMSSTFGGDCIALAAAKATLEQLMNGEVNARIIAQGTTLMQSIASSLRRHKLEARLRLVGYPALFDLTTVKDDINRCRIIRNLMRALAGHKIFWQESFVICRDFGAKESAVVAAAVDEALGQLSTLLAEDKLEEADQAVAREEQMYIDSITGGIQ